MWPKGLLMARLECEHKRCWSVPQWRNSQYPLGSSPARVAPNPCLPSSIKGKLEKPSAQSWFHLLSCINSFQPTDKNQARYTFKVYKTWLAKLSLSRTFISVYFLCSFASTRFLTPQLQGIKAFPHKPFWCRQLCTVTINPEQEDQKVSDCDPCTPHILHHGFSSIQGHYCNTLTAGQEALLKRFNEDAWQSQKRSYLDQDG